MSQWPRRRRISRKPPILIRINFFCYILEIGGKILGFLFDWFNQFVFNDYYVLLGTFLSRIQKQLWNGLVFYVNSKLDLEVLPLELVIIEPPSVFLLLLNKLPNLPIFLLMFIQGSFITERNLLDVGRKFLRTTFIEQSSDYDVFILWDWFIIIHKITLCHLRFI